jgi:hypothetical protein
MPKRSALEDAVVVSARRREALLARHVRLVPAAVRLKHARMAESPFAYFRAAFYRWVELWDDLCPELAHAPEVLAVGDLHVENFGTWRDAEGRLVWGVNDFDEVHAAPYAIDLVRLAASARISAGEAALDVGLRDACAAILDGYSAALLASGAPIVLAERHPWLRDIAVDSARDPARFWERMAALPPFRGALPRAAEAALERSMPLRGLAYERRARVAGLGSLGHLRVVGLALFEGAWIAREVKALAPPALARGGAGPLRYAEILSRAVRARDPRVRVAGPWLVRRLAPDCARLELADLPARRDEERLLRNMGWETANVHLGTHGAAPRILRHLARQPATWLRDAAKRMSDAISADAAAWRRRWLRRRR